VNQWTPILDHVVPALLVVTRLGGLAIFGPVFGASVIPVRIKLYLILAVGLAIYPALAARSVGTAVVPVDLWILAPMVATELMIGLAVGFMASLPLVAVQTGGLLMGQQMGLGLARFFNPAIDDDADILGQILFFMALAGFLVIGGHEAMLMAVLASFDHIPLGGFVADADLLVLIAGLLLSAFELALRVAAPVLALIFLESIAMGFIAKTVPQMNILSMGFPLRILAGVGTLALGLIVIDEVIMDGIDVTLTHIFEWIESG
jgi:flagellar biosynthetic protein FliR